MFGLNEIKGKLNGIEGLLDATGIGHFYSTGKYLVKYKHEKLIEDVAILNQKLARLEAYLGIYETTTPIKYVKRGK